MTAPAKITTYKRNSTEASYGSISKGDRVYILETPRQHDPCGLSDFGQMV